MSEIKLQLLLWPVVLCVLARLVVVHLQTFCHQFEVGLVKDNLGQVFLPFDLFFDSIWDIRDNVGQDELGKVNNMLKGEKQ